MRNAYQTEKEYFEGWYLKHQKGARTLALIPGIQISRRGGRSAFLQVITNQNAYYIDFPIEEFEPGDGFHVKIGSNTFGAEGISLDVDTSELKLWGRLRYGPLLPVRYDIMGPFKAVPFMECSHGVLSMYHHLEGSLCLNGETLDFQGGTGYIEKDRGRSFPKSYLWTQCNSFDGFPCSVMASVAEIPLGGLRFPGCICAVRTKEREYRLATYLGGKAEVWRDGLLILSQGKYRLTAEVLQGCPQALRAPQRGNMERTIHEHAACRMRFRFTKNGETVFDLESASAGFEFV